MLRLANLPLRTSGSKKNLVSELNVAQCRLLVDMNGSTLPISTQVRLLELNRSGLYYQPILHSTEDLHIKQMIDKIYTRYPMYGYRRICWYMNEIEHYVINHKVVLRHMKEMGIQAIYPRQNTSRPEPANKIYPYLLKGLKIDHPDQLWSIDITYIPVKTNWLYLVAIIDWYSRFVLHWQLSDTMEIDFVIDTSRKALNVSSPEFMNSDQGSHFTRPKFTQIFLDADFRISMYHRGRAYDNIFIERLWRTIKYEDIYPKAYETPKEAHIGIHNYIKFYNHERPHSRLKYRTPEEVYRDR